MSMARLTSAGLKRCARQAGLDLCGIARAAPAQTHARYLDWLARGDHAHMAYLARPDAVTRRADPRALLPSARSLVVVGVNYYAEAPSPPRAGKVARYAWGTDYHPVLQARLEQLAAWLQAQAGRRLQSKICVDTSALLEREWAVRAGLGWIGKNGLLINPRLGSWLLLGALLVDLELEPDPAFLADRCGTCTRCLQACPTGSLRPGRMLDARRCIAYLTIELRGELPVELATHIKPWLFGCDVCQHACPWNRFASPSPHFPVNPAWASLDPAFVQGLDEDSFRAYFAGSALERARRAGLARNAAAVMRA
jgi:epoxyqueuosine reductase